MPLQSMTGLEGHLIFAVPLLAFKEDNIAGCFHCCLFYVFSMIINLCEYV